MHLGIGKEEKAYFKELEVKAATLDLLADLQTQVADLRKINTELEDKVEYAAYMTKVNAEVRSDSLS
jgi:uncharacterized radical SAM superfamily protein